MMRHVPEYQPFPNERGRNARQESLEVPAMVRALRLPQGVRVLEVGCGRGIALPALERLCKPTRLAGLDHDHELLAEAQSGLDAAGSMCELVCADVRQMPFEDDSFDVVIDFGTLYHVTRADDGLREVARVLAPTGLFVHETRISQLLSHPVRARGRRIPWEAAALRRDRWALLWATRAA